MHIFVLPGYGTPFSLGKEYLLLRHSINRQNVHLFRNNTLEYVN